MSPELDFAALFDIAPNAYMVLDRELRYVAANATYLEVTASTREGLIGRKLFDLFPNDPADPNNVPAQMLRKSLERVLSTGERDHLALIPYRVPLNVDGEVRVVDRYWSATHVPITDAGGKVAYILQHTVDVTALHERERATREAEGTGAPIRDEAGVFARARAVQEENARIDAERENLRILFEQAPGFMCVLDGERHVFRLANEAYTRVVGKRDLLGKPVAEALPEVVAQGFVDLLDRVFRTGEAFIGAGVRILLQRTAGSEPEEAFVDFVYQPVRDREGRVRGIFVQGHDVTERTRAERVSEEARRAAEAFSEELQEQSKEVQAALDHAKRRIAELEARLAGK
jgi:PAS domain S-box-containing protein